MLSVVVHLQLLLTYLIHPQSEIFPLLINSSQLTGVVLVIVSHMLVLIYSIIYLTSYNCGHATCTAALPRYYWAEHKHVHFCL